MAVTFKPEEHYPKEYLREVLDEIRRPFEVAVWSSENYFNMGSIIRIAHNFLAKRIWGIDLQDPEHPISKPYYRKAAMTSLKWELPNINLVSQKEFIQQTTNRNLVAFERREDLTSNDIRTFEYPENPILLFGSEKHGVSDLLLERADHIVSIPCDGFVLDGNVAVMSGIAMYDWFLKFSRPKRFT